MLNRLRSSPHARLVLWLAALALLFAATSPTLNALRVKWLGEPQAFAELCTKFGMVKAALDSGVPAPAPADNHGPECAACLSANLWLALSGSTSIVVAGSAARHEAPDPFLASPPSRLAHTVARSRAPPQSS